MFEQLIESGPRARSGLSPSASSIAVHATLIVLAVHAMKNRPAEAFPSKPHEISMELPATPRTGASTPGASLPGAPILAPPDQLPFNAPVDVPGTIAPAPVGAPRLSPGDLARQLAVGSPGSGSTDWLGAVGRDSLLNAEPPVPIELADPVYPSTLKAAGIEGSVTIEFVVATDGSADSSSVKVIAADFEAFGLAARDAVLKSRFRPGRVNGAPVRVRVRQMVRFLVK